MPVHGALEDLLTLELPTRDAVEHALIGIAPAHAMHAQDLARLTETAELFSEYVLRFCPSPAEPLPLHHHRTEWRRCRSVQSMKGEMSSAPMTSALRTTPVRIIAVAVESP